MNPDMDVEDETRTLAPTVVSGPWVVYLPHELIVWEILVRLPVKSLLRFRCVCKAWRDTISGDASFSEAHVRRHQPQKTRPSSLLIAPYITTDDHKLATPGLYLWDSSQRQDGVATRFLVEEDWSHTRHGFAHCDGLVMLPDDEGTVRVLNPATRRSLTLPRSPNCATCKCYFYIGQVQNAFGFGRDPRTGAYKVARSFHRDILDAPFPACNLGMEVFTIGDGSGWRETVAKPPCPFLGGRTATFFKGSLIWTVDVNSPTYDNVLYDKYGGVVIFVRFSLEDESFSVVDSPERYPGSKYKKFRLAELHGELAVACPDRESVKIWICDDVDGVNGPRWVQRHKLNFQFWSCIRLVADFDDGILFVEKSYYLWRRTSQCSQRMVGMNTLTLRFRKPETDTLDEQRSSVAFHGFDVIPYIPTLVPI